MIHGKELIEFVKANNLISLKTEQMIDGVLISVDLSPLVEEEEEEE